MGQADALPHLYNALGERISMAFDNWLAVVLTPSCRSVRPWACEPTSAIAFTMATDLHCSSFSWP